MTKPLAGAPSRREPSHTSTVAAPSRRARSRLEAATKEPVLVREGEALPSPFSHRGSPEARAPEFHGPIDQPSGWSDSPTEPDLPSGHVDLNGRLVLAAKARVSVFDRGLLYGDGVFDTLRCYGGLPFELEAHTARLQDSCAVLGIVLEPIDCPNRVRRLLARNALDTSDAWVRITVTRGPGPRGLVPPKKAHPTILITAGRLDPSIAILQRRGAGASLLPFARGGFLAEHKTIAYLSGVIGKTLAADHGLYEGLYVDADGRVTEGTTTNIFAVHKGKLLTPPPQGILAGLTRGLVAAVLAPGQGVDVVERPLPVRSLQDADEAFLTSSLAEIVPLVRLGGRPIGSGRPGPLTRRLQQSYRRLVRKTLSGKR